MQLRDESQKIYNILQYDRVLTDSARDLLITDLRLIDEKIETLKGGRNG